MGDIVWSEAKHTHVEVRTAADAEETYLPDDGIHGSHALFIGGDLGLVIEGDLDDLRRVAEQIAEVIREARDAPPPAGVCDCDGEPVPGAWIGMNDRDEVQRCDDCERFDSDEAAADAVAAAVGGGAVGLVRVGAGWAYVLRDSRRMTAEDIRSAVAS